MVFIFMLWAKYDDIHLWFCDMKVYFKNKLNALKENEKSGRSQAGYKLQWLIHLFVMSKIQLYSSVTLWRKKTNKTTSKMQMMEDKIGNGPEWISVVYRSAYSRLVCFILTVIPFVSQKRRTKNGGGKWEKNTKT